MPFQKSEIEYIDDLLGSKLTWRLLRVLVMYPFLSFRLSYLSSRLKTSNKSILRIIRKLTERGLVLGIVGSHERYRINPRMRMTRKIWSIFMSERILRLPKEAIDITLPYFETVKNKTDAFVICECPTLDDAVIFNDRVYVAAVSDRWGIDDISPAPLKLNVSLFTKEQFTKLDNPISQCALLNGIVLRGEDFIFSQLACLKSFPQPYVIDKLDIYSRALSQNGYPDQNIQKRQLEIITNNIHDFETQFDIREDKYAQNTLLDRINYLKTALSKDKHERYI